MNFSKAFSCCAALGYLVFGKVVFFNPRISMRDIQPVGSDTIPRYAFISRFEICLKQTDSQSQRSGSSSLSAWTSQARAQTAASDTRPFGRYGPTHFTIAPHLVATSDERSRIEQHGYRDTRACMRTTHVQHHACISASCEYKCNIIVCIPSSACGYASTCVHPLTVCCVCCVCMTCTYIHIHIACKVPISKSKAGIISISFVLARV